ncbi:hypothetical protein [Fenollaria sporofastidiosus]|uniref:hypothetical protein n=1 Tax=Fenollaria sporofastidiosus TaxID=2811778 RepID=UPI001C0088DB|nr:hypothetical protein [Fenollaria sporofastidiosus]
MLSDANNFVDDLKEYSKDANLWYEKLLDYQELIKDINQEIKYFRKVLIMIKKDFMN